MGTFLGASIAFFAIAGLCGVLIIHIEDILEIGAPMLVFSVLGIIFSICGLITYPHPESALQKDPLASHTFYTVTNIDIDKKQIYTINSNGTELSINLSKDHISPEDLSAIRVGDTITWDGVSSSVTRIYIRFRTAPTATPSS